MSVQAREKNKSILCALYFGGELSVQAGNVCMKKTLRGKNKMYRR